MFICNPTFIREIRDKGILKESGEQTELLIDIYERMKYKQWRGKYEPLKIMILRKTPPCLSSFIAVWLLQFTTIRDFLANYHSKNFKVLTKGAFNRLFSIAAKRWRLERIMWNDKWTYYGHLHRSTTISAPSFGRFWKQMILISYLNL